MKKILLIIFVASLFVGCKGYKWQKTEKQTQTVHILEVGNFPVKGEVVYANGGRVVFTDFSGRKIIAHMSRCVIVETPYQPKQPQVQQPVKASVPPPTAKKVPAKVPGEKTDK